MKLLKSKNNIELPKLFLIRDREEIKNLPLGIPFFLSTDEDIEDYLIRLLEFEVLYNNCIKTGYPFNFKKILENNGFKDIENFSWQRTVYMDYVTEDMLDDNYDKELEKFNCYRSGEFKRYVKDGTCYIHLDKIKELNVFPIWLDKIEKAISTNIHNFSAFNPNMYNKKLEGMYGNIELTPPSRNLIVSDISASIPKAIGTMQVTMAKFMSETFYCDLLITGKKTKFIPYEEVYSMDMQAIYDECGNSQECVEFRKIITDEVRDYKTCIIFGDNHSVCDGWGGEKRISKERGKELCKWKIHKMIAFHTTEYGVMPGFGDWFDPEVVEYVDKWVTYLK